MDVRPLDIWSTVWGHDVEIQDVSAMCEGYVYACDMDTLHQGEMGIEELVALKERPEVFAEIEDAA